MARDRVESGQPASDRGYRRTWRVVLATLNLALAAGTALGALFLSVAAGSAVASTEYKRGPKLAPGVFLAKAPKAVRSADRQAPPSFEPRIVGGDATTIEEWPWQVAIAADAEFFAGDGFDRQFCGGTLVAPAIVVSAAHCFFDVLEPGQGFDDPDLFAAITGRTQLSSSTGQEIEVANLYFFVGATGKPLFNPKTLEWDAVFVRLAAPSPGSSSTPIQIAGADEAGFWAPGDENAWATGWGTTSSGGDKSDILREVKVDRIADSVCGSSSSYGDDFDPETMLCAGEIAGGQDTCQGDSGGPLVTPIDGGAFRLIGDTSWGFGCALPDLPGVYGRVAEDPMCSALQGGIQDVAAVNVVGPGGCLGASPPDPVPPPDPAPSPDPTPEPVAPLPPQPAPDTTPPEVELSAKKRQRAGKPIEVEVSCNEECTVTAGGKVVVKPRAGGAAARVAGKRKKFKLRTSTVELSEGDTATLKLKPRPKRAGRKVTRLVKRVGKGKAKIKVQSTDRAGNSTSEKLTVTLKAK